MKYTITFAPEAQKGLAKLKRSEPTSFNKAIKLLNEIAEHPKNGTGHPEPLKGKPETDGAVRSPRNTAWFIEYSKPKSMLTFCQPTDTMATNNR